MHSFSQPAPDFRTVSRSKSGEKGLIKALAIIVNREGNKKTPYKKIDLPASECP